MKNVTLAVIAGGAGSRMGGPKWELVVEGQAVLVGLMGRMQWQGPTMLVLGYDQPGDSLLRVYSGVFLETEFSRVVRDERAGEGPLAGVLNALRACETEWMVSVPVDMPGLGGAHVKWVAEHGVERGCSCAMVRRNAAGVPRIEPFPVLLPPSSRRLIEGLWASGGRALRDLVAIEGAAVLDAPHEWGTEVWANLNTPADVRAFSAARDRMK